jgi:hypothetical protein
MWQNERGYLLNPTTWSSYMTFLIFIVLALLISIPTAVEVRSASQNSGSTLKLFYPFAAIVLFGILAMNLGQMQQEWVAQFGKRARRYYLQLLAQIGFLLLLMLPAWIVYQGINHLPWERLIWGFGHLFVYGLMTGLFGLLIGLKADSDIAQFNIKYATFIAFALGTAIWLQPLNPFLVPMAIFGDAVLNQSIFFFLQSYVGFGILIAMLWRWTYRQIQSLEEARL